MVGQPAVAIVGTGTIGAAWAAVFLSHGFAVRAHDPAEGAAKRLSSVVAASWAALTDLGAPDAIPWERLTWCDDIAAAARGVAFVQESGPERLDLKHALVREIDKHAPPTAVIASSSSGLRPSLIAEGCIRHPERVVVGHPFHPAHIIPLVEVVPGGRTSEETVAKAMSTYTALGKRPVLVQMELAGHLVNRLQAALWREAYDLVARGAATVADIDAAITNGPGLRWAAVGPFAGQHLSGGADGIAGNLEHLGPPMVAWWDDLATPRWTPQLITRITEQMADEMGGVTSEALAAARDQVMLKLLAAKADQRHLTT